MATVTYVRPSGTDITVNNCAETKALAKQLGWKKKKQVEVQDGDSSTGSEGDTSGDIGTGS